MKEGWREGGKEGRREGGVGERRKYKNKKIWNVKILRDL
jgi:hypothetical protein